MIIIRVASLTVDSRFSITQNLSWSQPYVAIQRKRYWTPRGNIKNTRLHVVVRVHRNYFELKVSFKLLNGKKQTYLNITCCTTIGWIII